MVSAIAARKSRSMGVVAVAVVGIIVFIVGAYIVAVKGAPFRGSGLGTVLLVVGVVPLLVAAWIYTQKPKPPTED
jgi:uncharacterized membrane protein YidH (DUF202 family)